MALTGTVSFGAERGKPNVLFIAVDDLRPQLGCFGDAAVHSPNIDALAAGGMVFRRAYCQQAVCSPSRTSLLTGLRPDSTRVYDLQTHFRDTVADVVTLPQHFKRHGYHVEGMGKIYHGGLNDERSWSVPWRRGSAPGYALAENREMVANKRAAAWQQGLRGRALSRAARGPATEMADVPDEAYPDGQVARMAVETLDRVKEGPFFLAVGFLKPHLPFVAPKKYWDLYDPSKIRLADNPFSPKDAPPFAMNDFGELRVYDGTPKRGPVDDALARRLIHGYNACVSYTDAQIGLILDELDRLRLAENTIVVLWGDHGWKLGEHGSWCKHTNFELDANAPLVVRAPGMKAPGKTTGALVEFVDIYPTLCELAGLPVPETLEGTGFAPLLDTPERPWKSAAMSQYPRYHNRKPLMGYSMRTDRYRFTLWQNRNDASDVVAVELYDHREDPAENRNLAADPANERLVEQLTERLRAGWKAARPADE